MADTSHDNKGMKDGVVVVEVFSSSTGLHQPYKRRHPQITAVTLRWVKRSISGLITNIICQPIKTYRSCGEFVKPSRVK